jgi:hypothetical protein
LHQPVYNPDMSIVLPALAVGFAAFCVWLAVRIVNRRERWAIWTAAGLLIASACLAAWWWTRPMEGILFDPIDIPADGRF